MSIRLKGSTSGYVELEAAATSSNNTLTLPNGNGTSGQYLQTNGSGALSWQTVTANTQNALGTEFATTSGASFEWTGLPTWVRQIIVSFNEVSVVGTTDLLVQFSDSGGLINTGYVSTSASNNGSNFVDSTSGFIIDGLSAGNDISGHMIITKVDTDTWVSSGSTKMNTSSLYFFAGRLTAAGTVTSIRIALTGSTFNGGTANIWYVG
jgi:hypothetical protein